MDVYVPVLLVALVCFCFVTPQGNDTTPANETSTDNSTLELASTTVLTANTTKAPLNTKGSMSTPKADAGGAINTTTTTKKPNQPFRCLEGSCTGGVSCIKDNKNSSCTVAAGFSCEITLNGTSINYGCGTVKCDVNNHNRTYWCCDEKDLCNDGTGKMEKFNPDNTGKNKGSTIGAGLLSVTSISILAFLAIW